MLEPSATPSAERRPTSSPNVGLPAVSVQGRAAMRFAVPLMKTDTYESA